MCVRTKGHCWGIEVFALLGAILVCQVVVGMSRDFPQILSKMLLEYLNDP